MRILVIRLSAMGDVAMSVPVVGALRKQYPEAQIVVLTPAFLQPFFRGIEALEFVSPDFTGRHKGLKGVLKLSSELGRFDMVADLHDVIRTKMLRRILRLRGAKVAYIDKGREEKKALVALENKKLVQLKTTVERYREVFLALGFEPAADSRSAAREVLVGCRNRSACRGARREKMDRDRARSRSIRAKSIRSNRWSG